VSGTGWLLPHLVSAAALAGVGWTVQLVVYPAFAQVGEPQWAAYHARHSRAITRVVAVPWAVQGVSTVGLLLQPATGGLAVALALAVLALVTVLATVLSAVPAHGRLGGGFRGDELRVLLRANLVRTLAWTVSAGASAVLLAVAESRSGV
jgi:hypothetical protein